MAAEMINEPRMQNMQSVDKYKIKNYRREQNHKRSRQKFTTERAEPKRVKVSVYVLSLVKLDKYLR